MTAARPLLPSRPIAPDDVEARFGPLALRLAPRVVANAPDRVVFEVRPDALGSEERAALERAGARFDRTPPPGDGWSRLAVPRAALERASESSPGLASLASTARAALAPHPEPALMGVLNATPDSFSDGGRHADAAALVDAARRLAAEGAAWIDVGGESTRPGAEPVAADEELARVAPLLELWGSDPPARLSIDTTKARVAARALDAGAELVNDVSAGRFDPAMFPLVADRGAGIVLMHMAGEPRTMQVAPRYDDVVREVTGHLRERAAVALAAGVAAERIVVDPGIGFGKTKDHNLLLLARLDELRSLGLPILLGVSRKAFLGALTGRERPSERTFGTAAAVALGVERGAALLRVHDVAAMKEVLAVVRAVRDAVEPR